MASKINTDARGNQPNLDTLVTAEIVPGEKIVIEERSEETIIIINVGEYLNPASVKEDMEIINMEFSGSLCINISDPLMMSKFVQDPTSDPAYDSKLKVHELMIPNQRRDVVQPQIIMLESQAKGRHFLHWISPGLPVTFQEFTRYGPNGLPQVDINNSSDQRFMWVIPVDQHGSNQFSLKPYEKPCYLTCELSTGEVILHPGDIGDQERYTTLRFNQ